MIDIKYNIKIYGSRLFLRLLIQEVHRRLVLNVIKKSHSQFGEDLIIDRLLGNKKTGFYVDIGAYDPNRFSNTKRFYDKGWRGINIEPDYDNFKKFEQKRKRDINLNIGIGRINKKLILYRFKPGTVSTFSKKEAEECKKRNLKFLGCKTVKVARLDTIFSQYCKNKEIDFISIDVEGFEKEVLESNDWKKFRPKLICMEYVEHYGKRIEEKEKNFNENFWLNLGYKRAYNNGVNFIYMREK